MSLLARPYCCAKPGSQLAGDYHLSGVALGVFRAMHQQASQAGRQQAASHSAPLFIAGGVQGEDALERGLHADLEAQQLFHGRNRRLLLIAE